MENGNAVPSPIPLPLPRVPVPCRWVSGGSYGVEVTWSWAVICSRCSLGELVVNQGADTTHPVAAERNESQRKEQDLPFSRNCY